MVDVHDRCGADATLGALWASDAATGKALDVAVPAGWVDNFERGSLRLIELFDGFRAEGRWSDSWGKAMLVTLKAADPRSPSIRRELRAVDRLSTNRRFGYPDSGCILPYYDMCLTKPFTFAHTAPDTQTLANTPNKQSIGVEIALECLIDILRGVQELEEAGLLHGALTPANIVIVDDRAMIAGLNCTCVMTDADAELGCGSLEDTEETMIGSPLWQAPEVVGGAPTGPKNHVWSAGLLFAAMSLGYNPVATIPELNGVDMDEHRDTLPGREIIREAIRNGFHVDQEKVGKQLGMDVARLLAGMLAACPYDRWSTAHALAEAQQIAHARGIRMLAPAPAWGAAVSAWSSPPSEDSDETAYAEEMAWE